jgi:hypothetical protein
MSMAGLLIAGTLLLAGCATSYQEMGFTGGVEAQQVTSDTWRILARGNSYTSDTRIQDFVLMKAAETTKAAGATHFFVGASRDQTLQGTVVTPGSAQTTVSGRTATTTFSPSTVSTYVKPGQDTYVRVVRLPPGSPPPPGALSADEIIQFIGPRLKKPTSIGEAVGNWWDS